MMPTPAPASTPVAASTPSLAPTTPPTAGPSPTPLAFVSAAYGYRVWLPADRRARQAQQPWDGRARIDSNGPYVDSVTLPGSIILFVYGAPTGLDLEAYATKTQAQMVAWHACPATPDSTTALALDGTPGGCTDDVQGCSCRTHVRPTTAGSVDNMLPAGQQSGSRAALPGSRRDLEVARMRAHDPIRGGARPRRPAGAEVTACRLVGSAADRRGQNFVPHWARDRRREGAARFRAPAIRSSTRPTTARSETRKAPR